MIEVASRSTNGARQATRRDRHDARDAAVVPLQISCVTLYCCCYLLPEDYNLQTITITTRCLCVIKLNQSL